MNIADDAVQFKEFIVGELVVSENEAVSGEVTVKSSDYARVKKMEEYKEDKEKFLRNHFLVDGTSIAAKEMDMANIENDSLPFEQHGKFTGALNTTGEYSFLPLNIFTGFDVNPFLSDNRFSNINFGYRRTISLNLSVGLPANFIVDEIPKSVRLTDPDKDIIYLRQVSHDKENNFINCMMLFEFKKSLYETDMYPTVKEVYKRIFDYLKEPVVLKRK